MCEGFDFRANARAEQPFSPMLQLGSLQRGENSQK